MFRAFDPMPWSTGRFREGHAPTQSSSCRPASGLVHVSPDTFSPQDLHEPRTICWFHIWLGFSSLDPRHGIQSQVTILFFGGVVQAGIVVLARHDLQPLRSFAIRNESWRQIDTWPLGYPYRSCSLQVFCRLKVVSRFELIGDYTTHTSIVFTSVQCVKDITDLRLWSIANWWVSELWLSLDHGWLHMISIMHPCGQDYSDVDWNKDILQAQRLSTAVSFNAC